MAVLVVGLGALSVLWAWSRTRKADQIGTATLLVPGSAPPSDRALGNAPSEDAAGLPTRRAREVETPGVPAVGHSDERVGSIGWNLAEFYGAEWGTLRSTLAQRIDLDLQPDVPLPPFERVLDELREQMRIGDRVFERWRERHAGPDPVTVEYLTRTFHTEGIGLGMRDVAAIEAGLVEIRAEIQGRLERLRSLCDAVLARKFQLRLYDRAPYANITSDKIPARAFHLDGTAIQGWVVTWGIAEDEDPDLSGLLADLGGLSRRRMQAIRDHLATLR